ncbi:hypothetical protein Tco_0175551 [Tanacetum coccineum]
MQTQEDHSNPIPALNVDSLKVDLVVIQNTCSEKEDNNSETASTKSVKECSLNSKTKDQLEKDKFQEDGPMAAFWVINKQFQQFINSKFTLDYDSQITDKYFVKYTRIEVKHFRDTLLQHMGNVKKSVAERTLDNGLVVMESNGTESEVQDDNSRSGNDTDVDDADIRPIYDEEPMAEIQEKVFAIAALKNELRKLKGNSVDTKFARPLVLGKPVLQPLRKQPVTSNTTLFSKEKRILFLQDPIILLHLANLGIVNDMVHNHYLDEAKNITQERDRNSKTSVMPSARFQSTANDSKPKPRSNNQTPRSLPVSKSSCVTITAVPKADHSKSSSSFLDSKNFVCSTCHKYVFNANHDVCITKHLKEVNSFAKTQSHKTRNINKLVDQKSHTQKPGRQIFTGHRFSPNKTFAVYEKTSPRFDLSWKPMGRIFKYVGLRWIPTRKLFDSYTSKVDSEPPHGSNVDIHNIHECKQTMDVSAGISINVQKEQSLDLSADSTSSTSTLATIVSADGNFNL